MYDDPYILLIVASSAFYLQPVFSLADVHYGKLFRLPIQTGISCHYVHIGRLPIYRNPPFGSLLLHPVRPTHWHPVSYAFFRPCVQISSHDQLILPPPIARSDASSRNSRPLRHIMRTLRHLRILYYTTICGFCSDLYILPLIFISFLFFANAGWHILFTRYRRLPVKVDTVLNLETEYEKPVVSIFRLLVHWCFPPWLQNACPYRILPARNWHSALISMRSNSLSYVSYIYH